MGMDLYAISPADARFERASVSWTGWDLLRSLLTALNCDVSSMADSNDGDVIDADTCQAWAVALDREWANILLFVDLETDEVAVVPSSDTEAVGEAQKAFGIAGTPLPDDEEFGPELADVRDFLAQCGGCTQH